MTWPIFVDPDNAPQEASTTPDPCNEVSEHSDAPERPLRASQTPKTISATVMDWMETEKLNTDRAAEALGIGRHRIVAIISGALVSPSDLQSLSTIIPGLIDPNPGE